MYTEKELNKGSDDDESLWNEQMDLCELICNGTGNYTLCLECPHN